MRPTKIPPPLWQLALTVTLCLVCTIALVEIPQAQAQAQTPRRNTTTDPSEARALNAMFRRWGISAGDEWNISGNLCSGVAVDSTAIQHLNPGIKCDCSYNDSSTCHITALRVNAQNVVSPLPDELWNLTYLEDVNLAKNYLTGPLSPSIARLTRMKYLSFGHNDLSGELPKELGNLTNLSLLAIGTNNFSGPLPSKLGRLTELTQFYFDSSGVNGTIPSTFADLRNLEIVFASDNELTGQIPNFIGGWSKLTSLRLEGNSFRGPIPSTFSNLTSLKDLRVSDISNGSSTLKFLRDLKNLTTLNLRNNHISGSLPSFLEGHQNLSLLDLSFNNFSGRIPDSLFSLTSLTHLFLGNNRLAGVLPARKSSVLLNIDLSYNELAGNFPSWVNQQNMQLNLVANNFVLQDSNSSSMPSGLNCLQRNFPCNRGDPRYSRFAIKCGGPQMISAAGIVYEADNESLGPATYKVTREHRWAVSNVGLPSGSQNPRYTTNFPTFFPNISDPELFQNARISAGSLRYYGLGLENGNYNVTLQFGETEIDNPTPSSLRSLGRRIFDIYIQDNLEWKDFDIKKEAGGASFRAVVKEFRARVTENYLEIHLFWAGKGTCCVPAFGVYGPSISAISVIPDFIPTVNDNPPDDLTSTKKRTGLIMGVVVAVGAVSIISLFGIYCLAQRRKMQKRFEDEEFLGMDARPYTFSHAELRAATDDFSSSNKVGEGGFGHVYKGKLKDGMLVAVKQLSLASRQGKSQFGAEIATISSVQHRNLVKLYGCCIEGDKRVLVYEYLENGSLDQALFGRNRSLCLEWPTRFDICLGVARGLAYLHEESRLRIVHRDIKASNILLDSELNPKISDFGLARLYDDKQTHISTRVAGTIGYLAPEYAMRGHLTEKADVFGFGVVALEIVSGRANSDSSLEKDRMYLLEWAWHLHENDREMDLLDKNLSAVNEYEVKRVIGVALLCTQTSPTQRPSMSRVVAMLCGDAEISTVISRPVYLSDLNFSDISTFAAEDTLTATDYGNYNSSTTTGNATDPFPSPASAVVPMVKNGF